MAEAWWPKGELYVLRFRLAQMQMHVILALTREYRSASTGALKVVAGIPSLEYKMDQESDMNALQHGKEIEINAHKFSPNILEKIDNRRIHPRRRKLINWEKSTAEDRRITIYINSPK